MQPIYIGITRKRNMMSYASVFLTIFKKKSYSENIELCVLCLPAPKL